jgi:exodeoxyribonuclease VII large subunit
LKIAEEKKKLSASIIAIINTGKEYLFREKITPANFKSRLGISVRSFSVERENSIKKYLTDLKLNSIKYLKLSSNRIEALNNNLLILNPENVLKRGYTLTSLNGCIVKNAGTLKEGDIIDTQFSDGSVKSKVT